MAVITLILVICLSVFPPGALGADIKTHPEISSRISLLRIIAIPPPRVVIYQVDTVGISQPIEEWTDTGRRNLRTALEAHFTKDANVRFALVEEPAAPPSTHTAYTEMRALHDVVTDSILTHTFDYQYPWFFSEKARDFRYSVGPGAQLLFPEADAILMIEGYDERSTGGRMLLQAGTAFLGALGALSARRSSADISALSGVVTPLRSGGNIMSVSLIETRTGDVLWFSRTRKSYDLRDMVEAEAFVQALLEVLPVNGK